MTIEATWYRGTEPAYSCESGCLRSDALEPIFGPDWSPYAPLSPREPGT